jgi:2-polyprenyl-3-methyl-5-hydroxy-6-metoxy-1,4-benzoquinol methylase
MAEKRSNTSPGMPISEEYRLLNTKLHQTNEHYGRTGHNFASHVAKLRNLAHAQSVLDYGCGKGTLAEAVSFEVREYDPAIVGKDKDPQPADLVVCTDVLEHIEPEYLDAVLAHLASLTRLASFFVVHTGLAQKELADGRNAHLIIENSEWWHRKIGAYFHVSEVIQVEHKGKKIKQFAFVCDQR